MTVNRDKTGRFQKGNKSGGRPKMPKELREYAKANSLEALTTVIAIMNDKQVKTGDRLRAAEIVLERGFGKAVQDINVGGQQDNPIITDIGLDFSHLSVQELKELLNDED